MWIGILVLCTFGAAALVSAFYAIRSAFNGNWHLTIGLAIPAIGIGGSLLVMVGPTAMIEIAGNPDLEEPPAAAQRLSGAEIAALFSGQTHAGTFYEDGAWLAFTESYDTTDRMHGAGGPSDNPTRYSWSGEWKVEADTICLDHGDGFSCVPVFLDGDEYLGIDSRGEVDQRFRLAAPVAADATS